MRKQRINRRKYSNRKRTNRKYSNRKQVRGGSGNDPLAATAPPQDQQDGYFTFKKAFYFFCSQIPLVSHSKSTSEKKKKEEDRDNEYYRNTGNPKNCCQGKRPAGNPL